jgi:glucosamine--fructose-6-phosphate aminotransferase (isomerizing)
MCGIIGILMKPTYRTSEQIVEHLETGLQRLQNRGYDSCGVGLLNGGETIIEKYASTDTSNSLSLLSARLAERKEPSWSLSSGIGHNRWATHGSKTDENAHPHLSYDKRFMVVHNGIIENCETLKANLPPHPYLSETDTEVVAHLLSHHYEATKNTLESIRRTIRELKGTYGLVIINRDLPDHLYCVRNGSPLLVGASDTFAIVTSEQSGFGGSVNTYITLETDDICILSRDTGKIRITTTGIYTSTDVTAPTTTPTPAPFPHWTLKEIHEQPSTILNNINLGGRLLNDREVKLGGLETMAAELRTARHVILLGCGSSYNAALYGAAFMKQLCNFITVQAIDASELQPSDLPKTSDRVAVVLISQSGETKDLHRCLALLHSTTTFTVGIVNVVDSLLARDVDCGVYCNSGTEVGVASTKSFTSQVVCLSLVALWFAQNQQTNQSLRASVIKSLRNLSNDYARTLAQVDRQAKALAETVLKDTRSMFILGKGCDKYIADESALKIKEISYIHTESYSASSLKHGPFALLDADFPVIIINCEDEHDDKITSCYHEVKARHSPQILISTKTSTSTSTNNTIIVPKNKHYGALLALIPLQLMSYYLSINKGINPDTPKNLAKVVTVD